MKTRESDDPDSGPVSVLINCVIWANASGVSHCNKMRRELESAVGRSLHFTILCVSAGQECMLVKGLLIDYLKVICVCNLQ